MSHFTRVKTQFRDLDLVVKALEDLGYAGKVERHGSPVALEGWGGTKRRGEVVVRKHDLSPAYSDLGFERQSNGDVAMWADSDFVSRNPRFATSLTQRYAYHATLSSLTGQGFSVAEETSERGEIRLVLRRFS